MTSGKFNIIYVIFVGVFPSLLVGVPPLQKEGDGQQTAS